MATHAGTNAPRSWGLIARPKAFTGRLDLDARLAAGANEQATPELARRAQVLVFTPHPPGALREAAFRAAFHAEAG
jgi:hypothetical protein